MEGVILFLVLGFGFLIFLVIVGALLFGGLRTSLMFTVHTQEAVIVERFGKFKRVAHAGLNFKTPFIDNITKPVSLRVQQLEVNIESKTKDNVFVNVP
ncbi:MAG: SPFH domain-containing protein, partial [Brachybacterium sp.]